MTASSDSKSAFALARKFGAAGLRATMCWQSAQQLLRLGFAASLAVLVGRMIEDGTLVPMALAGAVICLVLSGLAGLLADWRAARAEKDLAHRLNELLQIRLSKMLLARIRARPAGALIAGLQRHPGALASLAIGHSAARSMLAVAPLLAAAAVAIVSWEAALTLLLAIPVMIIFFVLLGDVIRAMVDRQEKAFGRLAAQFSDRIRTLPTILANHALRREREKIEQRMTVYAGSTMRVLKVAFLNAGIIDFFSALSIAVLAVFLGLGHLGLVHVPGFTGLALWQSLFILIVAADFFTPFRRYAEQYHIKAEGETAAKELAWYFNESTGVTAHEETQPPKPFPLAIAFDTTNLPDAGLVAISGPSGAGKSTLLRALAGLEPPAPGIAALPQASRAGCDWMSTDIYVPAGTLADAIAWNRASVVPDALLRAAERVGLIDDRLLPGGLAAAIAEGGDNLSGGQRMRIGIARILLSSGPVLADEPTAKLDPRTAELVRQVLIEMAARRLVIVATHDEQLIASADRHHALPLPAATTEAIAA